MGKAKEFHEEPHERNERRQKTLVIRNGALIDGSGKLANRNDAIVIEGNKVKSVGALPPDISLDDRKTVEVVDAAGKWIMPGLIDHDDMLDFDAPDFDPHVVDEAALRVNLASLAKYIGRKTASRHPAVRAERASKDAADVLGPSPFEGRSAATSG